VSRAVGIADLPPGKLRDAALRAYAETVAAETQGAPRAPSDSTAAPARRQRTARGRKPEGYYRCARCGARETALAAAERHADATGHCRIEIDVEGVQG
jgi:hypothetical protein